MVSAYESDNDRKFVANQQLEASTRRLAKLVNDLERIKMYVKEASNNIEECEEEENSNAKKESQGVTEEDINNVNLQEYKAELEENLENEVKNRDLLQKTLQQIQSSGGKTTKPANIQQQIQTLDRSIETKKKDLEKIVFGDEACKQLLKKKIAEQNQIHEFNGHKFKTKQFSSNITACSYCHDAFWGASIGLECTVCHTVCHKSCQNYLEISCQEVMNLRNIRPKFFMAQDNHDRNKWIQGLLYYRNEYEKTKSTIN